MIYTPFVEAFGFETVLDFEVVLDLEVVDLD
jgi:hypothetical protein